MRFPPPPKIGACFRGPSMRGEAESFGTKYYVRAIVDLEEHPEEAPRPELNGTGKH